MPHYLIAHEGSLPYIRSVTRFLHDTLSDQLGDVTFATAARTIDEVATAAPATVFIIGERLDPFTRRPGHGYVYFNFSVVARLGSPFATSLKGLKQIRGKQKLLRAKLPLIDAVLDYYPAQTPRLARQLPVPTAGFLPCSEPQPQPLTRTYDIAFVGGLNPRRQQVLDALTARGISLSPTSGADLETLTAQSRLALNVHTHRTNHLEIPRIIGALSTGTPVITEPSYGLKHLFDTPAVIEADLPDIPATAAALLADPGRLAALSAEAAAHFTAYHRRATDSLSAALAQLQRASAPQYAQQTLA
ncbi:glycosyltransferase [Pseudoruegeria sp. HB172150]|uniref:glycosyltransferase family protein n=1 Tax=Pseudoruegeria sp. HB172150 TaxID=2721164 RepID=UPI001555DCB1|nr:glycosyltransferase [Pseudoruegeria sp. HB172150]